MIVLGILCAVLALGWAGTAWLLRRAYTKIGVKQARIDDLSALCDSQTEFVTDTRPIHETTKQVREEIKAIDAKMAARAEQARVVQNMLHKFLFAVIDRLDPVVAEVARRNVTIMFGQIPSLTPQVNDVTPTQEPAHG